MNIEIRSPSWKTWSITTGAIALAFTVLVTALTLQSQRGIRQQIVDRDGYVLAAVASMLQSADDSALPVNDLDIVLQTSRLRGVLGVRLFDAYGQFIISIPRDITETEIETTDYLLLHAGEPVSRFHAQADLKTIFARSLRTSSSANVPLQEILIPLHSPESIELEGIVQYFIDGDPVAQEFAALDQTLLRQAGSALALGLVGLFLIAAFAFLRLRKSHMALAKQTERLLKANRELSLAARTSAIGAITAHLIHGIRNPLTGLDLFFQTRNTEERAEQSPNNWKQLAEATYRIRELVDDVVEVLRDHDTTTSFELSLDEVEAVLREKLVPKATGASIHFETIRTGNAELPGHAANLILLIIMNLFDNAVSLTPKGKKIWVEIIRRETDILFEIGDEGPGIPVEIQPHIFTPGRSGRPGGTGLGLAISHRLAANINADLALTRSDNTGTVFALICPIDEEANLITTTPMK